MTYSEKLRNPKWQRKRLEILQRDNFKCCLCGDEETELHVHHLKYTGEPHEAPNEDLESLCKDCHLLKTLFCNNDDLIFIKSVKKEDFIIAISNDNTIYLFQKTDNTIVYLLGFLEKGFLFDIVKSFSNEFWNKT